MLKDIDKLTDKKALDLEQRDIRGKLLGEESPILAIRANPVINTLWKALAIVFFVFSLVIIYQETLLVIGIPDPLVFY